MFRHFVTVLMLDGVNCTFRSKSQPELNSSILVELKYTDADPTSHVSHGFVKSNRADKDGTSYKVVVELDAAQNARVGQGPIGSKAALEEPVLSTIFGYENESKRDPATKVSLAAASTDICEEALLRKNQGESYELAEVVT